MSYLLSPALTFWPSCINQDCGVFDQLCAGTTWQCLPGEHIMPILVSLMVLGTCLIQESAQQEEEYILWSYP